MKGEKIRVIFIYILIVIIVLLVGYLIFNFFLNANNDKNNDVNKDDFMVTDSCEFDVTSADYINIIRGDMATLCGGNNRIIINNIILDGNEMNVEVRYYNGQINEDNNNTGVYIDGKRIIKHAANNYKNQIGIFDNKLFILSTNSNKSNVAAYDANGNKVYDLESALIKANISDPAFVEMAKSNSSLNVIVKSANIDSESFNFVANQFTFSTNSKADCKAGQNIGSTYRVTYSGNTFNAPEFTGYVSCNR